MTKEQALHSFWSSFGLTAYEENSVPSGENKPDLPYITYEVATDRFESELLLSGNLWYEGNSWEKINAKTDEIANRINNYVIVGCALIKPASPFATNVPDINDRIRRKKINITVEFLTAN
jgi:hypothetical protein